MSWWEGCRDFQDESRGGDTEVVVDLHSPSPNYLMSTLSPSTLLNDGLLDDMGRSITSTLNIYVLL